MSNKKNSETTTNRHSIDRTMLSQGVKLPDNKENTPALPDPATMISMQNDPNANKRLSASKSAKEEASDVEVITDFHTDYSETNMMLKSAIGQTDMLINDISADLKTIRASKAMTNKYRYITDLTGSMASLISTKINAARELNSSLTHAIDFNMKQAKELRAQAQASSQDDDKRIMEMYSAYMSVPMGTYPNPNGLLPSMREITLGATNPAEIGRVTIGTQTDIDAGYQDYLNNMTPTQNAMRYENNPDIQTVVVYDQSNGNKWFDVINIKTGESIPNVSRPDEFLLNDTRPDLLNMVARNSNIDRVYPLIIVGQKTSLQDY